MFAHFVIDKIKTQMASLGITSIKINGQWLLQTPDQRKGLFYVFFHNPFQYMNF